ncbi:unnamed protein product [Penicillium crustosum]
MSGVELGLAVLSTADLCLKYGSILLEKYRTFKGAESEIDDKILSIELFQVKTECQMDFLKNIWHTLPSKYQDCLGLIYPKLQGKLQIAVQAVEKILKKHAPDKGSLGWSKRLLYTMRLKETIERTIEDVNEWQRIFEPTWFLVLRVSDSAVRTELRRNAQSSSALTPSYHLCNSLENKVNEDIGITLSAKILQGAQRSNITFSEASLVVIPGKRPILIDSAECQTSNISAFTKDVRYLAQRLRNADPLVFQILNCGGIIHAKDTPQHISRFDFVFQIPKGMGRPQTLRQLLLTGCQTYPLSDRVRIANQLAKSVSFVHMYSLVHKNIRPETIMILEDGQSELGSLFLTGFKIFRMVGEQSGRLGDSDWARNIYRHPRRQGLYPEEDYRMLHDIYSLGVCLLEIGLWESLVQYESFSNHGEMYLYPNKVFQASGTNPPNVYASKALFEDLAKNVLPAKMGKIYAQVVLTCLTYYDEEQDAIVEGVTYIERVSFDL